MQQPLERASHGIALYNHERQLMWAWGPKAKKLEAGEHQLCHTFPLPPLRPGPYPWLVTRYEDSELVDRWDCSPEMIAAEVTSAQTMSGPGF